MDETIVRLLDLYCCGGGAAMGYAYAGFEVVGVDIEPQPYYPFEFNQGDAIEFVLDNYHLFDAIHASPPCQAFTKAGKEHRKAGKVYDDFLSETRDVLQAIGMPYIIENVPDAPMQNPIELCGAMFGLETYRHRLFESNIPLVAPPHPVHVAKNAKMGRKPVQGEFIHVVGHFSGVGFGQRAMGIPWLGQKELAQAIPPAYTEYLGRQLMGSLNNVQT
jgi:DNA (cytosine-5)-methyltransferase 1